MAIKASIIITIIIFVLTGAGIAALVFSPGTFFQPPVPREIKQTRVIERQDSGSGVQSDDFSEGASAENVAYRDSVSAKIALEDGELLVSLLNENFDDDLHEEQIIAYRNLAEIEGPICITYVDFDEADRVYKRVWDAPTLASRSGTIDLFMADLVGDRVPCVLVSGMNGIGEHTLSVFRKNPVGAAAGGPNGADEAFFVKIAEIQIDGSIFVREAERTQAYQMGMANGASFPIVAYGRDAGSSNILDQIEIIYTYDSATNRYVQSKLTRIQGKQVEEQRIREILSGGTKSFENFLAGLWYYVAPGGIVDDRQYIYFDPQSREVIFYVDETQQIFTWQHSGATRSGLYMASQNISVQTLRRSLDIALESLESIRVKVFEDVRLKIGSDTSWDGSYRKVGSIPLSQPKQNRMVSAYVDGVYNGIIGKISFSKTGDYELSANESTKKGKYSFFVLNDREMLEMRPENSVRETYLVDRTDGNLSLQRIRIGANGIQNLHEPSIFLYPASAPVS